MCESDLPNSTVLLQAPQRKICQHQGPGGVIYKSVVRVGSFTGCRRFVCGFHTERLSQHCSNTCHKKRAAESLRAAHKLVCCLACTANLVLALARLWRCCLAPDVLKMALAAARCCLLVRFGALLSTGFVALWQAECCKSKTTRLNQVCVSGPVLGYTA